MRISLLGGLRVEHDHAELTVSGTMQLAVLFRLAIDAGAAVSYRAIIEDVWGMDAPENERAALQSVISRLRSQLPPDAIESTIGGYRLAIHREDVDALVFTDLVARASTATGLDARRLAAEALDLWKGDPWIPSANFDWFERDLRADHAIAVALGGVVDSAPSHSAIPAPLTSLVGRETELAMISNQLRSNRLVTIVGTGGAGKTRLAIETAIGWRNSLLVELAPVGDGEVLGAILASTGRELRLETPVEQTGTADRIVEALFGREVLLVLDNCEHVISEAARVAEELLRALPQLRILATSREPLAVPGEGFVAVGSLPHPSESELDNPLRFAAVELFRQRAVAARGSDLDHEELVLAARICSRLDGLPLAIELAAARLRTMSLDEVHSGLDHRFTLLTGGYRTALPRHQTLRAMIDWSWSLLSDEERTAIATIAVFPAGVAATDTDALSAAMGLSSASVFDSLVDKSLLQRSRGRYRALETVREYGIERLAETAGTADARALQARHLAARTRHFDSELRGRALGTAIAWFDAEEDNIAAALRFTVATPLPDVAVDLLIGCAWYWIIRERQEDATTWFSAILPLASSVDGTEALVLQLLLPVVELFSGGRPDDDIDVPEVIDSLKVQLAPLAELTIGAGSHDLLQIIPPAIGAFAALSSQDEWMLQLKVPSGEELGLDPWPTALLHVVRAAMAQNHGNVDELGEESRLALDLFTEVGDFWGIALSSQMRSEWLSLQGRLEETLALSDTATEGLRSITPSWDLAQQRSLGIVTLVRLGRLDEARERVRVQLEEADEAGDFRTRLQALIIASMVDISADDADAAAVHLVETEAILEAAPHSPPPQLSAMVEVAHAGLAILHGDLDEATS